MTLRSSYVLALALSFLAQAGWAAVAYLPGATRPPVLPREFRGAWIATVSNIDWPSTNSLTSEEQKAELVALLDHAAKLKLNGVLFQVRPACDVLYPSKIEPWSEYLTGRMGKAPSPFYDPLEFAIAEAHKRGLELHAWFNPYRARHPSAKSEISPNHISKKRPDLVRQYGRQLWLDPGEKAVQDYSLSVVMEVLKNYDVDGIHFDDYFYPYKEAGPEGKELDFPDDSSWKKLGAGSKLSREDWRRENVNAFIQRVNGAVKELKPWVKFGVSPFGIWRPGYPPQIKGYDAYSKLYADARKWLANGWVDYLAPQLYWSIDSPGQSYPVLLKWWAEQNQKERQVWPGLNSYAVGRTWKPDEIARQIKLARNEPGVSGHIHWDLRKGLMAANGLTSTLLKDVYTEAALAPVVTSGSQRTTRSGNSSQPMVTVTVRGNGVKASWKPGANDTVRWWVVQTLEHGRWSTRIVFGSTRTISWSGGGPECITVSAVDRYGVMSAPAVVEKKT